MNLGGRWRVVFIDLWKGANWAGYISRRTGQRGDDMDLGGGDRRGWAMDIKRRVGWGDMNLGRVQTGR